MNRRCRKCYFYQKPACDQRKVAGLVGVDCFLPDRRDNNQSGKLKANISISITKELISELFRRISVLENKSALSPEVLADYRNDIEVLIKLLSEGACHAK